MNEELNQKDSSDDVSQSGSKVKNMEALGLGLVLVWFGAAFLLGLNQPAILIGLGVVVLAVQGLRYRLDVAVEAFWVVVGILLFCSGVWAIFSKEFPTWPVILIVLGGATIFSALRRMRSGDD